MAYSAFISYSRADEKAASAIQYGLQNLARPWYKRNALAVFRDKTGLAASSGLAQSLNAALDQSQYLIVVTSSAAADSHWVAEEVSHWIARNGIAHVLIADTTGALAWDEAAGGFGPGAAETLPPPLLRAFPAPPLWVNVNAAGAPPRAMMRVPEFRHSVAQLAATLRGCPLEDLIGEDAKQHKRTRRIAGGAMAALTVLAILAVIGVVAAVRQTGVADQRRRQAQSNQLSAIADRFRSTDPALAAQFDAAAYHADPTSSLAYTNLLNDESVPLNTVLNAATANTDDSRSRLSFSPDGRLLAESGGRDPVALWNLAPGGAARPAMLGAAGVVDGVPAPTVFSPAGRLLLTGGAGGVHGWDVTAPEHPSAGAALVTGPATALVYDHSGRLLAAGGPGGAFSVWSMANPASPVRVGGQPATDGQAGAVVSLVFSVDGRTLSTGSTDGTVDVWNVADLAHPARLGTPVRGTADSAGFTMAFRPDGSAVSATDGHGNNALWRLDDAFLPGYPPPAPNTSLTGKAGLTAFGPDGDLLAVGNTDGSVALWNLELDGYPLPLGSALSLPRQGFPVGISGLAISPDGQSLAAQDNSGGLVVWRLPARYRIQPDASTYNESRILVDSDGHTLAAAQTRESTVDIWSLSGSPGPTRLPVSPTGTGDGVFGLAMSPASGLVVGTADPAQVPGVNFWTVTDPAHPVGRGQRLPVVPPTTAANPLALSPDGHTMAVDSDRGVTLWSVGDPAHPAAIGAPLAAGQPVFAPDGRVLALVDKAVTVWNVANPAAPVQMSTVPVAAADQPAFTHSGQLLLVPVAEPAGVTVWSLADPAAPTRLGTATTTSKPGSDLPIALSPDDHTLAVGAADGTVALWNLTDPAQPAPLGHPLLSNVNKLDQFLSSRRDPSGIVKLVFSADGRTLASVNADSTIRMWYTDPQQAIAGICGATRATLTPQRWQQYAADIPYQPPCPGVGAAGATAGPAMAGSTGPSAPTGASATTATAGAGARAGGPCQSTGLGFEYGAAPADDTVRLVITNTAAQPCTLNNVPDVRVYGVADAQHDASYQLRHYDDQPQPVTLAPGGKAHVDVMFAGPEADQTPWIPQKLTITLPFSGGTLSLPWTSGRPLEPFVTSSHPPTFTSVFIPGP